MNREIQFHRRRIIIALGGAILFLTAASLVGQYSTYYLGDGHVYGFVPEFNLDREMNIPTWFASVLFLFSALLLWQETVQTKKENGRFIWHWRVLTWIFVFLSIDEVAAIHEMAVDPVRNLLHVHGFLYFAWVIPGAILVFILILFYFRFFISFPAPVRRTFFLAAGVFLAGSLGLEMIGGWYVEQHGNANFIYACIANAEEALELTGQLLFLNGLLRWRERQEAGSFKNI